MITKLKKHLTVLMATFALLAPGAVSLAIPALGAGVAGAAANNIAGELCEGANEAAGGGTNGCGSGNINGAKDDITGLARSVVNIISILVGVIAIIFIIFGGFRYITSGGDSGRVGNAKNTLIYAIIGLIIVALAQIIVRFVVSASSNAGANLTS